MAAVAALILATGQGYLVALFLVFFIPGYMLVAALFPGNQRIDWIERIALSLGLSVAVIPLLGLFLNFTPFGLTLAPILLSIVIFSGLVGGIAYVRRRQVAPHQRLSVTIEFKRTAWQQYSPLEKALTVVLVAVLISSLSILTYVLITPRPGERFTEFYVLGTDGTADNYPTELNVSEEGTILIGVVNREFERVSYVLRVDLLGLQQLWNETGGINETVEVNRTTMASMSLSLDHETNWTSAYSFRIDFSGLWKVEFLLFREGDLDTVYRSLHLFVTVLL